MATLSELYSKAASLYGFIESGGYAQQRNGSEYETNRNCKPHKAAMTMWALHNTPIDEFDAQNDLAALAFPIRSRGALAHPASVDVAK